MRAVILDRVKLVFQFQLYKVHLGKYLHIIFLNKIFFKKYMLMRGFICWILKLYKRILST